MQFQNWSNQGIVAFCNKSKCAANVFLYINVIKLFLFLSLSHYSSILSKVKGLLIVPYRNRHVILLLRNSKNTLGDFWTLSEKKISYLSYTCSNLQVFRFYSYTTTIGKILPSHFINLQRCNCIFVDNIIIKQGKLYKTGRKTVHSLFIPYYTVNLIDFTQHLDNSLNENNLLFRLIF